jgi:hypothetical protein
MDAASHLKSNAQDIELIGVGALKKVTDLLFPTDEDMPYWTWGRILLRDIVYFQLRHPDQDKKGCQHRLDVRHVSTGQTREEWVKHLDDSVYDLDDLSNPHLWLIGVESLNREYSKLFVHHSNWRCPDATDHTKWLTLLPDSYAERRIDLLVPREQRGIWEQQVRTQGINPCVYSVIEWWMLIDPRLRL